MKKRHKNQQGFSLLEVILGIVILGYAMIIMAKLFGSVTISAKASEYETLASNFARAKMEDLKNRSYDTLVDGVWTSDAWSVDTQQSLTETGTLTFNRQVRVTYMKTVAGVLTTSDTDQGLKKISVKVVWPERGKNREIEYTSLVARGL